MSESSTHIIERDPRVGTGPWPCLPGCKTHRGGDTGGDVHGECSVTTEVACRPTGQHLDHYQVYAWQWAYCGARAEGSVECVLVQELTEHAKDELRRLGFRHEADAEVEDARFSLPPAEARAYAEAILRAVDIAEGPAGQKPSRD